MIEVADTLSPRKVLHGQRQRPALEERLRQAGGPLLRDRTLRRRQRRRLLQRAVFGFPAIHPHRSPSSEVYPDETRTPEMLRGPRLRSRPGEGTLAEGGRRCG